MLRGPAIEGDKLDRRAACREIGEMLGQVDPPMPNDWAGNFPFVGAAVITVQLIEGKNLGLKA